MTRCQKCGSKTIMRAARVQVEIGDSTMSTITDVNFCEKCKAASGEIKTRIELIGVPQTTPLETSAEVKGHA